MKLNHLNLTVADAMETRLFLEKYFGLRGTFHFKAPGGFVIEVLG